MHKDMLAHVSPNQAEIYTKQLNQQPPHLNKHTQLGQTSPRLTKT